MKDKAAAPAHSAHLGASAPGGLLPRESSQHTVSDTRREGVGPLTDSLVADADALGRGGDGTPEQIDSVLLLHDGSLNHSSAEDATADQFSEGTVRPMSSLSDRFNNCLEESRSSITEAAKAIGISYQAVKKIVDGKTHTMSSVNSEAAARFFGVSSYWLATGIGPKRPPVLGMQAHTMSHPRPIVGQPIRVAWGDMSGADLGGKFEVELVDDALAPDYPAGTVMRFDAAKARRPGWPCVVRDLAGNFYIRDYEQGAGDDWRATARSRGFAPLSRAEHGLTYIAPMYGVDFA